MQLSEIRCAHPNSIPGITPIDERLFETPAGAISVILWFASAIPIRRKYMSLVESFKQRLLQLELSYVNRIPLLVHTRWPCFFNRKLTADISVTGSDVNSGIEFRIDFRTPYFHLPVAVLKSQVGQAQAEQTLAPSSFRFFDWHSWTHLDGIVQWHGERTAEVDGVEREFISGFSYRIATIPPEVENLGVRVAEGVEGTVSVLAGRRLVRFRFDPGYWMLEPGPSGFKTVPISDPELMVLIVSLSEIGSGSQRHYATALRHLKQWTMLKLGGKNKEQMLLELLRYVRDWGPLRMEPLFPGLGDVLKLLDLEGLEHVIFEFYADNWGVHGSWQGRLLAVKMLETLATGRAAAALSMLYDYVKNRDIDAEEMATIHRAINRLSRVPDAMLTERHPK